jgi:phosphate transport system substrate-binding protein
MIRNRMRLASLGAAAVVAFAACSGTGATQSPSASAAASTPAESAPAASESAAASQAQITADLAGAGATFPEPIYIEWIGKFQETQPGVKINYQGIGSGGGREQFIAQQVDFAGSDAPMKDEEITSALDARKCKEVLHIPTLFGGVAMAYNIPGLDTLILDPDTIAGIGLGTITNINDPKIAALNPGVTLPDQALTFAHRSDSSGTTNIFTTYLNDVSDAWAAGPGKGSEIEWPTGLGGDGNDGVASAIKAQPGGIGYVSYEFAVESGLQVAQVVNKDGKPIAPSTDSVAAAADTVTIPEDFRFSVLGVGGDGYPIVGATWILAYTCGMDANKADALKAWLTWAVTDGDDLAKELNYAPLSDELQDRVLPQIEKINEEG